jgi:hypothetical protein
VTDAVIADRPPCGHGRVTGEERAEEGDDRRGQDVSERERARAWLGWPAGPRALLGRTGADASVSADASASMGRAVGPSQREKEESARDEFCFSFSKM